MATKRRKELALIENSLLPAEVDGESVPSLIELNEHETRFIDSLSEGRYRKGRLDLAYAYQYAVDPKPPKDAKSTIQDGKAREKGLALWSRPEIQAAFREMVYLKMVAAMTRIATGKEKITVWVSGKPSKNGDSDDEPGATIEVDISIKDRIAAAKEVQKMIGITKPKAGSAIDQATADVASAANSMASVMARAADSSSKRVVPAEDGLEGVVVDSEATLIG